MGRKIWLDSDSYVYPHGTYVRQKLGSRAGCKDYRMIQPKEGRYVLLCRKKGGKWKAVALLRHIGIDLRTLKDREEAKDIQLARKLLKKLKEFYRKWT